MIGGVKIDYQAAEPPYRQIAAWLRKRIEEGEFGPGQRLPTERDLQETLGVAATTTRRAMRLLADGGWITTTPGRGSHVRPREDWPQVAPDA
jgi:DNA-binding GntR family transcriptional regulator